MAAHGELADIVALLLDGCMGRDFEDRIAGEARLAVSHRMGKIDKSHGYPTKCWLILVSRKRTDSRRSLIPFMPSSIEIHELNPTD